MIGLFASLARPVLRALDPETAHGLTIAALSRLPPRAPEPDDPALAVEAFGLRFPNPVGLAAGFDKNAEVPDAILGLGFGFTEVGTLTPRPQSGNPKPRLFRLVEDEAVVNRLGFNNEGHEAGLRRLGDRFRRGQAGRGIIGVNIGANRDSADKAADYVAGIRAFAPFASYFTVNVSSPNTPGLRDLQAEAALDDLVVRVLEAADAGSGSRAHRPVLVKIAPDVTEQDLDGICAVAAKRGIDGLIVSNTTISRPAYLTAAARDEQGGLSGRPLFALSTRCLAMTYQRMGPAFPLIGVGGVDGPDTALAKIEAGASLVQLYTALIYRGPGLVRDIKRGLLQTLRRDDLKELASLRGRRAAEVITGS